MRVGVWNRVTAMLLALSIIVMSLPMLALSSAAVASDMRVADPSTMDDWKLHFGKDVLSTQNAGGVWTDKSVFTNADAFSGTGITMTGEDNESFLVALSAIASNSAVEGQLNIPTDTMLVLDLSDSMYQGGQKDPHKVQTMLAAVNDTITSLQAIHRYNRVGVVVYYGGGAYQPSNVNHAEVMLPLGRYESVMGAYLQATVADGKLHSVDVADGVTDAEGTAISGSVVPAAQAGAYLQLGILRALDEFLSAEPKVSAEAEYAAGQTRLPVMVVMTDGAPTAATADYTRIQTADMGNNADDARNAAQTDFVTQLTAAYAKAQLDAHYESTTPLFYTLRLGERGVNVTDPEGSDAKALQVLGDPSAHTASEMTAALTNRATNAYWDVLLQDDCVDITVQNGVKQQDETYTVTPVDMFPMNKSAKYYADTCFTASDAAELAAAFVAVTETIRQRSHYFPTLVDENEKTSGYISFHDTLGAYMTVTDIKGILIDNTLFSGALLSKNFITGGGELGSFDKPTSLGDELVWAVQKRLGIDVDSARDLLGLAYRNSQLTYNAQTGAFSNYIGWYANADEDYLGFWYDGIETMPDPHDTSLDESERPRYVIRSYLFLGAVDEEHGVSRSNMMYTVVQVRKDLLSGDEMMLFEIPAALIPTVTYNISLDENGEPEKLTVTGAEHPVRLVYEVGLDPTIDRFSVCELVASEYAHKNPDGTYDFYAGAFDADNRVGYTTPNTRTAFVPSRQNERYYYTEDSLVYANIDGTPYTGDSIDPNGVFYRGYTVYSGEGTPRIETRYERISVASLTGDSVERRDDGCWYILAGTVHTMLEEFVVEKADNPTASLSWSNVPYVDTRFTYYTGATLGNNGRLTLVPATGIKLSNTVADDACKESFRLMIESADKTETAVYAALLKTANGAATSTEVAFTNGVAAVELAAGQTIYIADMPVNAAYTVTQQESENYKVVTINGETVDEITLTVAEHAFASAHFDIAQKGYGNVTIIKRVAHDLGMAYVMPEKRFSLRVDLGAAYADAMIEAEYSSDAGVASVTADANGSFVIMLKNTEQFSLKGLKEGTVVTVEEIDVPEGFSPIYYGAGVEGQNHVVVRENAGISLIVTNRYISEALTDICVEVGGTVWLTGRENDAWLDTDIYEVELQKHNGLAWETVASATVNKAQPQYSFTDAMKAEVFSAPGTYSYRIVEQVGTVDHIHYDRHIHTFSVVIGDPQMNGKPEVLDVISYEGADHITGNPADGWIVTADFTNSYSTVGKAVAAIDVHKQLVNPSASDLVDCSGFLFGLFEKDEITPCFVSAATDMVGEARIVAQWEQTGEYHYLLKELVPVSAVNGMIYSIEEYAVTVIVSQDDSGAIRTAVSVTKDGTAHEGAITFTNRYEPTPATVTLPVHKTLNGRELVAGEFTFEIRSGGQTAATGTNDESGVVTFDQPLTFTTVGDHYFDVVEVTGDAGGVTYDDFVYRVHVRVTDAGGSLAAHAHVINEVVEVLEFVGYYKAAPATLLLEGEKTLVGRQLVNDEFTFVLAEKGSLELVMMTRNFSDGHFRFGPLTYSQIGEYRYALTEMPYSSTHGIVFDDAHYEVVVTVTDPGDGVLHAESAITRDGKTVDVPSFINSYMPTPKTITLEGKQTLTGRVSVEGEFTFVLYKADERWREVEIVDTTTNTADDTFAFAPLDLTQDGTYRYLVRQMSGGQTIDGVNYDDEVYRVMFIASDDHRGTLRVDCVMFDSGNVYTDALLFENTLATASPPTAPTTTVPTTTTTDASPDSPQTGDRDAAMPWAMLLLLSGSVCAALAWCKNGQEKAYEQRM